MAAYELEQRTLEFAIAVRKFVRGLPRRTDNFEDGKQVIRSSGSVGANYIEANEKLGEKDLLMRLKIARKEAKETYYWLSVLRATNEEYEADEIKYLLKECDEIKRILSSIISKIQRSNRK